MSAPKLLEQRQQVPMISSENVVAFEFPADKQFDCVTEGYEGKNKEGAETIYINKIHIVTPSGRLTCSCPIDPKKVHIFFRVDAPVDFRHLYCDESMNYLRREAWKIINHPTPVKDEA